MFRQHKYSRYTCSNYYIGVPLSSSSPHLCLFLFLRHRVLDTIRSYAALKWHKTQAQQASDDIASNYLSLFCEWWHPFATTILEDGIPSPTRARDIKLLFEWAWHSQEPELLIIRTTMEVQTNFIASQNSTFIGKNIKDKSSSNTIVVTVGGKTFY